MRMRSNHKCDTRGVYENDEYISPEYGSTRGGRNCKMSLQLRRKTNGG